MIQTLPRPDFMIAAKTVEEVKRALKDKSIYAITLKNRKTSMIYELLVSLAELHDQISKEATIDQTSKIIKSAWLDLIGTLFKKPPVIQLQDSSTRNSIPLWHGDNGIMCVMSSLPTTQLLRSQPFNNNARRHIRLNQNEIIDHAPSSLMPAHLLIMIESRPSPWFKLRAKEQVMHRTAPSTKPRMVLTATL